MPRPPRRTFAAVALTGALALTACGEDGPPERARTIGDPSATASPTGEQGSEAPDIDLEAAGRQLSQDDATAALPDVSALPSGWSVDEANTLGGEEEESGDDNVIPERCRTVFESMRELNTAEPDAEADTTFQGSGLGPFVGVSVSSFEDEVAEDRFDAVVDGLNECQEFTVYQDEEVTNLVVSPLAFANLGEDSIALRFSGDSQGDEFTMDVVSIRVGHNLVGVSQITIGGEASTGEAFEQAAFATMTNLSES